MRVRPIIPLIVAISLLFTWIIWGVRVRESAPSLNAPAIRESTGEPLLQNCSNGPTPFENAPSPCFCGEQRPMAVGDPPAVPVVNPFHSEKTLPHHPVFLPVMGEWCALQKGFVVEPSCLYVPWEYDCRKTGEVPWGGQYDYFSVVASRWVRCHRMSALSKSQLRHARSYDMLPAIDEEYPENVAVYQSALRAKNNFVFVEGGARWGTWGARAASFLRKVNPMPYKLLYYETNSVFCDGLRNVHEKNELGNYTLVCDKASPDHFRNWVRDLDHVDVVDLDIQGGEEHFVPPLADLFNEKVYRVIIGTHKGMDLHKSMKTVFEDWIVISEHPRAPNYDVCLDHMTKDVKNWEFLKDNRCTSDSPFGPFVMIDGELILDNPKFVIKDKSFSMSDTEIRSDDLK